MNEGMDEWTDGWIAVSDMQEGRSITKEQKFSF